jgi:hypothetical protein
MPVADAGVCMFMLCRYVRKRERRHQRLLARVAKQDAQRSKRGARAVQRLVRRWRRRKQLLARAETAGLPRRPGHDEEFSDTWESELEDADLPMLPPTATWDGPCSGRPRVGLCVSCETDMRAMAAGGQTRGAGGWRTGPCSSRAAWCAALSRTLLCWTHRCRAAATTTTTRPPSLCSAPRSSACSTRPGPKGVDGPPPVFSTIDTHTHTHTHTHTISISISLSPVVGSGHGSR